jgi:hypothetical protein
MTNPDQLKDPRLLALQQPNFRKPTMQYLRSDLLEIEEDPEPKKESAEIESLSYFEILCEIKLNDLIPPPLQESQ